MIEELLCPWESPYLLIFSSNVPSLLYYSHLPAIIAALALGWYLYVKRKNLTSNILVAILGLFSFYSLLDVLIWATNRSDIVLFLWSIQVMIEVLVFAAAFYLVYLVINKKDSSFGSKLVFGAILVPFILLIPTQYNLIGIDLSYCDAIEGFVALYLSYILEAFFAVLIVIFSVHKIFILKDNTERKKIIVLVLGVLLFLTTLISGNLIGSFTGDWDLAQFGLFGMPIFIGFLVYTVVRYHLFNIRLIGANVLVVVLCALIVSLLFIQNIDIARAIIGVTGILAIIFGFFLINSVRKEVLLREQLQIANAGQANLIHIINHQIKGYLSKARNIFSELLVEPEYGACTDKSKPMLEEGLNSLTEGVEFVRDFLDASNIEKGTHVYKMESLNFKEVVEGVIEKQKGVAEEKELSFETDIPEGNYNLKGDKIQLGQVVRNLIDNSIRYTPSGSIKVSLSANNSKILLTIQDTGVGISEELKPRLFTKGGRDKDSLKININSTGFGLAFVKNVVEAHKGRVWAESEGKGKGSTFYMELPL